VAVSARREQEASFFTVLVWRDQARMRPNPLSKGSRVVVVVVVGRLQQRAWTIEDGSARSVVEILAEELAEPAVGEGDDDQGDEEPGPVARSTSDMTVRDVGEACLPDLVVRQPLPVLHCRTFT
jgi:single-stranded DNA-binding protein